MTVNRRELIAALLLLVSTGYAVAHPLPNTVIVMSRQGRGLRMQITAPLHELQLALPQHLPKSVGTLLSDHESDLRAYFDAHFSVLDQTGKRQLQSIISIAGRDATHDDVGTYQELVVDIMISPDASFDNRHFTLRCDAIVHHVATHHVSVRWHDKPHEDVGILAYDFVARSVKPFLVHGP
jgi:hypothetical protein